MIRFLEKWILVITGILFSPIWFMLSFQSAGCGHGDYILFFMFNSLIIFSWKILPENIFYPANAMGDFILMISMGIIPVSYGFIIDLFHSKNKFWLGLSIVFGIHYLVYIILNIINFIAHNDIYRQIVNIRVFTEGLIFFLIWHLWLIFITWRRWKKFCMNLSNSDDATPK